MTTDIDIRTLQGRVVLVKSSRDLRNPPTAMRGWFDVHENRDAAPEVSVAVEFPQMFMIPAHHRAFRLDQSALERVLASERGGTFEYTVDEDLL